MFPSFTLKFHNFHYFDCRLLKVILIYMQANMQTCDTSDRPRCTGRRPTGRGWSAPAGECSLQPAALHNSYWLFIRQNRDSHYQCNTSRLWWVYLTNAAPSSLCAWIPAAACSTVSIWQQSLLAWLYTYIYREKILTNYSLDYSTVPGQFYLWSSCGSPVLQRGF